MKERIMIKERPILFSDEMVRALLAGRKTQTRRIFKLHPEDDCFVTNENGWPYRSEPDGSGLIDMNEIPYKSRYGKAGDHLWVKECFSPDLKKAIYPYVTFYRADQDFHHTEIQEGNYIEDKDGSKNFHPFRWRPSIHMPRRESRITLKNTAVRVETLNSISEADAVAEGIKKCTKDGSLFKYGLDHWPWQEWEKDPRMAYKKLWEEINGIGSWAKNPWVWAVTFEVIRGI